MKLVVHLTTHLITVKEEINKVQECTPSELSNFELDKFVMEIMS